MTLSVLGIIVSLGFLIWLALRGFHIIVLAPAAVVIVSLFSGMDPFEALVGPYMKGFVNYAGKFYLIFLAGSVFGKFMEDCGAARSIALGILKVLGAKSQEKVLWAIAIITMVMTYGGISLFVVIFAVLPIARPLFKELNIPWHLFVAALILGLGSVTMTMLPGSPSIQNIMPTKYLGTTAMAGPVIGILASIIIIIFNVWYFKDQLRRCHARNENFEAPTSGMVSGEEFSSPHGLPNVWLCLLPPITVFIMLNVLKMDVVIALFGGVIATLILFWKFFNNKMQTINKGALNAVVPIVNTSADVGYGMAMAATSGFVVISDWLLNMGGHPILSLSLATNIVAGMTGSASGGLGIVLETLSAKYLALGVAPDLIHRIAVMSSGCFDAMPHSGATITVLAVCGLTHAQAYKHFWWAHIVATVLALIIVIPIGIVIYG
ncbi:GntP family permease [Sporomusa termitida]|uniref:GntP family permease n=2 Tax=Sporomusa termitida TaxID=2377 RepID=A0A517DSJ2_9FIRM|nr:GntP family permease [Sporomusa termitida]